MPDNIAVWIVLFVAVALVVGLMVWRGRSGSFSKGDWKVTLDRSQGPGPEIKVAENLKAKGGQVGNITGVETTDPIDRSVASKVDVGNKARFENTNVGDITGVKISGVNQQGKH